MKLSKFVRKCLTDAQKEQIRSALKKYGCDAGRSVGLIGVLKENKKSEREKCAPFHITKIDKTDAAPHGIYAAGSLFTVYGTKLYVDGAEKGTVTDTDKVFCALGERVVIFPDKIIYANGALTPLESRWAGGSLTFKDGTYAGEDAQANTIYAAGVDWADYFKVGDAVAISGCTAHTENNRTPIIREIDGANLRFYENVFALGEGQNSYTETGTLKIERTVPDLDMLFSSGNRIWGYKDNTICCCKLGDPFNWNVFDGLSTDAWSVETGDPGKFTGCVSYLGYPLFFKKGKIFKVYGSVPKDFQLIEYHDGGRK